MFVIQYTKLGLDPVHCKLLLVLILYFYKSALVPELFLSLLCNILLTNGFKKTLL